MDIRAYGTPRSPNAFNTVLATRKVLSFYRDNWPEGSLTPWQTFMARVAGFFGLSSKPDLPLPDLIRVFWSNEPILGYDKAMGVASSRATVIVKPTADGLISSTALCHELMHLCLWNWRGTPDVDHLGSYWKGWEVAHEDLVHEAEAMLERAKL